jgi:exonuclease III
MRTGGRAKNIGWRLDYFVINKEGLKHVKDSLINN